MNPRLKLRPLVGWSDYEDEAGNAWHLTMSWSESCDRCGRPIPDGEPVYEGLDTGQVVCSRHVEIEEG